jgi:hypothetical protein
MPEDAGLDIDFDKELAGIQGVAAGVIPGTAVDVTPANGNGNGNGKPVQTVELKGRQFRIADEIGLMPLLKFSAFADVAVNDPRALGAMYALLRDCIHPGSPGCGECEDCQNGSELACEHYDRGDWAAFEDHAMISPGPRRTSGGSTASSSSRRVKGSKR